MDDIFISYAHIDNQPLTPGAEGWIAQFHRVLETRVAQKRGATTTIWRDPKLGGADIFSELIRERIAGSRILISVLSPRYIRSEWCVREVTEFQNVACAGAGVTLNHKSRIMKVVKTPFDEAIPATLKPLFEQQLGFEFFRKDPETNRPREFDPELGKDAFLEFVQRVDDVAHDVCELLKALGSETKPTATPAPAIAPSGRSAYLASTTSDLQGEWDRLSRELVERGHSIVPDRELPNVAGPLGELVTAQLKRAQVAVHLIGNRYGLVPEDSEVSLIELQNQLAAQRAAEDSSFRRFLWMPEGLAPTDHRQSAFVKRLFDDAEAQRGAELVRGTIEQLKQLVLERLAPPPAPVVTITNGAAEKRVYLVCDRTDEGPLLDTIEQYLFEKGLEISRPRFDGTEAEVAAAHRQNLQICDGVLIVYGAASRGWVDIKVSDLLQAPGYGRTKPFLAKAVAILPPDTQKRYLTRSAEVIRLNDPPTPQILEAFAGRVMAGTANPTV
jgi:hypothetical protein